MTTEPDQLRVIAAGDCSEVLSLLAQAGRGRALKVHAAQRGADLIGQMAAIQPHLVLLDAEADDPSALEACRALKQHESTVLTPVIAIGRSARRRFEAFAVGADDFVTLQMAHEVLRFRIEALVRAGLARRSVADARVTAGLRERDELHQAFRRYLSPQLADRILGNPDLRANVLGEADLRMRAVVMFADMRGFTKLSEHMNPGDVVPLLNEYFSLLTEITFRHEGTVFSMAGDCLMAGFGVPLHQPDSFERAIRTAQEMLTRFTDLAVRWKVAHAIDTGLGIGINEGEVVAGNVGSTSYMNYTIIGDTVNVASRLSQRARSGEVLFSAAVKRGLDERGVDVGALELPPIVLRGRSRPIDIWCVPQTGREDANAPLS